MSTSKYLPPFSPEERGSATRGQTLPANSADDALDEEVTYADFLGDQVDG
ncbi:MAG: hypothetical protein V4737_00540 [Curtobacterium sp.]